MSEATTVKSSLLLNEWLGAIDSSSLLPEERPIKLAYVTMTVLSTVLFCLLGWASITNLNEVSAAYGQVLPSGHVQVVQHLEGGIIRELLVKDGDLVQKGQPLARLDSAAAISDLNQARYQKMILMLEAEHFQAFSEKRAPNFKAMGVTDTAMILRAKEAFETMRRAREDERSVITAQITQRRDSLRSLDTKKRMLTQNLTLLEEEHRINKLMFESGDLSKLRFLEKTKELNAQRAEINMVTLDMARTRTEIGEYEARLSTLSATQVENAQQELSRLKLDIAKADEEIMKRADRVQRLAILSPVRGIVKGVEFNTIGGVIASGGKLMEIVPLGPELKVEARIRPSDIGQIRPGQPVRVKVHAFDYTHFGTLEGKLESLSATTFVDEKNVTYYRGIVKLDNQYVGNDSNRNVLVPGMTVDAEVITGQRTLLAYLLKPIRNAADTAFTEK
jgi:adhesin transport system membrane fusion protein